jgi:membrane protease YdiL (CAAX protease family)
LRLASCIIALAGLLAIGAATSLVFFLLGRNPDIQIEVPHTAISWIMAALACLSTGYLEESFFRYYLTDKLHKQFSKTFSGSPPPRLLAASIIISAILFALCHIWSGPPGMINALISALFLSCLIEHCSHRAGLSKPSAPAFQFLHPIAIAHALYDFAAYSQSI